MDSWSTWFLPSADWKHFSMTLSYFEQALIRFSCLAVASTGEQRPRQNSGTPAASQHSLGVGAINENIEFTTTFISEIFIDSSLRYTLEKKQCLPSSTSTRRYLAVHFSMAVVTIAVKSKMEKNFILITIYGYLWSLN